MCYLFITVIKYPRRQFKGEGISFTISKILAHGHYAQLLLHFCILCQSIMVDSLWSSKVTNIMVARWYRLRWRDWNQVSSSMVNL